MKTQILIIQAALVLGMAVFGLGCAKKGSGFSAQQVDAGGGTTGTTDGGTTGVAPRDTDIERGAEWQEGAIASFTSVDGNGWAYYAATHPLNAPSDMKISVKLNATANGYNGKVLVSYYDNGQYYTGRFITGTGKNANGTTHGHDGKFHSEYNKWFTWNGPRGENRALSGAANVYHGFYADQYGAIMLIVDGSDSGGDGQASSLKGEVWVRNYPTVQVPDYGAGVPCWFKEIGPYDCRTFLTNNEDLVTTSALYPDQSSHAGGGWYPSYNQSSGARGWRLLGRFQGLDRARAGL